jgi:hypothetical protein
MNRSDFLAGCALLLMATACGEITAPEDARPLTDVSLSRAASSQTLPFDHVAMNSCSGEWVELNGRIHMTWQADESGFMSQVNYQGVSGRGLTSQVQYRSTAMDHFKFAGPVPDRIFWKGHFTLIGRAGASRLHVTVMYTFDVGPNGEVRPGAHDVLTIRCHY